MAKQSSIKCIGIIMDGNRRYARLHNKPISDGHKKGYRKLKNFVSWAQEEGIINIVAYTFSTENWNRSREEVDYLMELFQFVIDNEVENMINDKVRVCFIGDKKDFSEDIQRGIKKMEEATAKSYTITLYLAVSYGGRQEILTAVNSLLQEGVSSINEEDFSKRLDSYPMPDPDIIIRTSGEMRLSNFLPWQSIYSEFFFVDTLWPDFSREEFTAIVKNFCTRNRRIGK